MLRDLANEAVFGLRPVASLIAGLTRTEAAEPNLAAWARLPHPHSTSQKSRCAYRRIRAPATGVPGAARPAPRGSPNRYQPTARFPARAAHQKGVLSPHEHAAWPLDAGYIDRYTGKPPLKKGRRFNGVYENSIPPLGTNAQIT